MPSRSRRQATGPWGTGQPLASPGGPTTPQPGGYPSRGPERRQLASTLGPLHVDDCTPRLLTGALTDTLVELAVELTDGGTDLEAALRLGDQCTLHVDVLHEYVWADGSYLSLKDFTAGCIRVAHVRLEVPDHGLIDLGTAGAQRVANLQSACASLGWPVRIRLHRRGDDEPVTIP